jgi:hypothetical protein
MGSSGLAGGDGFCRMQNFRNISPIGLKRLMDKRKQLYKK